jgi:hypothetical protein
VCTFSKTHKGHEQFNFRLGLNILYLGKFLFETQPNMDIHGHTWTYMDMTRNTSCVQACYYDRNNLPILGSTRDLVLDSCKQPPSEELLDGLYWWSPYVSI